MEHLIGKRIKLGSMPDDPNPIPDGTIGTVTSVSDLINFGDGPFRQIHVEWDSGHTLMMVSPPDTYEVVT